MTSGTRTIATAVAALDDDLASQIAACIEILKVESDIGKRRVAESRFLRLSQERKS